VYQVNVASDALLDARTVYVDASSGEERLSIPLIRTQQAVGEGRGVHGDRKKLATRQSGSVYLADDMLRPPVIATLDVRGVMSRLIQLANGAAVATADYATDTDNDWGDAVAVDAHVYMGWTYDYLYKRLGVRGFNNADAPVRGVINPYTPQQCVTSVPPNEVGIFCVNAFWTGTGAGPGGQGLMVFGNGIPSNFVVTSTGQTIGPLAGALDVVAHELAHGVTDYTSGLEYRNESGALNEAFSDMVGVAVEAFFEPVGAGLQKADYLVGEDAFKASRAGSVSGIRSIQSPVSFGDPDHWSVRYTGTQDNGGVHVNSGIPNHAYYLAIEGGSNRVSRLSVTGVGFGNRELVEKVFFRAFTRLLPARATFVQARAATIQAARDLYPTNSSLLAAVTDAWTAVGVQ
jgi:thermolysin